MCGPEVMWNLLTLDLSYLMVLIGGSVVLRAKSAGPFTWFGFGVLSIAVGGFLFWATWSLQTAAAAANAGGVSALTTRC